MRIRQAKKIWRCGYGTDPRYCCVRDITRVKAFRRLAKCGEGPWCDRPEDYTDNGAPYAREGER